MSAPRVSVALCAYNSEDTIDRAIESVVNQTMTDWELIAVDDCSTDGTYEKLLEWAKRDSRIQVTKNEVNLGIAGARNVCFELADASYVAIFDSDDICHPDRLLRQADFLDEHAEYALVGSKVRLFDDNGYWGMRGATKQRPQPKDLLPGPPHSHPTVMHRAGVLKKLDYYSMKAIRCEDYDYHLRLYAAGYRGYNILEPLLDYYESNSSLKRRKFRYRLTEFKVRYRGFKALGLLPKGLPYVFKPIIAGLTPKSILMMWRKYKARKGERNVSD